MVRLDGDQRALVQESLTLFRNWFSNSLESALSSELAFYSAPPEIVEFKTRLADLQNELDRPPVEGLVEMPDDQLPALKAVLMHQRRELATQLDEPRDRTSHPALLQSFDDRLRPFAAFMTEPWFRDATALRVPRLSEFLALERVESILRKYGNLPARLFDEKFHILQSPALVRPDLRHFRRMCGLRGCSVALAYLDIDHFKVLNTKYGESAVDVRVLPVFMRELEASVFFRGFAYRYGGDEYVVVLPNVDQQMGIALLHNIRTRVQALCYRGIAENTTVSVGVCLVEPESFLTDREVEERANRAKNYAKDRGRIALRHTEDSSVEMTICTYRRMARSAG